jgi:hypothetical protein
MLPAPNLPGNAPAANPYAGSVIPSFGANAGGYSPVNLLPNAPAVNPATGQPTNVSSAQSSIIGGQNMMSAKDIQDLFNSMASTYGAGPAHDILDFLTSGAGFNQNAINNLFAAMQPGIERSTESLLGQFSTTGNRFSSGGQIGLADYLSQVQLNQGQLETQMYEQATNDYLNTLMGVSSANAQRKASSPSTFDKILGGLETAGGIAAAPFTGGASLGLVGAGIGEMTGKAAGAAASPFQGLADYFQQQQQLSNLAKEQGGIPSSVGGGTMGDILMQDPSILSVINSLNLNPSAATPPNYSDVPSI